MLLFLVNTLTARMKETEELIIGLPWLTGAIGAARREGRVLEAEAELGRCVGGEGRVACFACPCWEIVS